MGYELPEDDFDPLDRLLDEARWPAASAGTVERLRGQWQAMTARPAKQRRVMVGALLAAAGVLLVAVMTAWLAGHGSRDRTSPEFTGAPQDDRIAETPDQPQPAGPERGAKAVAARETPSYDEIVSRPPTPYEQVLIVAAKRQAGKADSRVNGIDRRALAKAAGVAERRVQPPPVAASVRRVASVIGPGRAPGAAAIRRPAQPRRDPPAQRELCIALLRRGDPPSIRAFLQRVADPQTSSLALSCVDSGDPPAEMLMEFLTSANRGQRIAAAQVLGRLNRPEISRRLIEMVRFSAFRQEALLGLLCSSEPSAQEFLTFAERNPLLWATLWNAKRLFETLPLWRS